MKSYIIIWKTADGQPVSTTVDRDGSPVLTAEDEIEEGMTVIISKDRLFHALENANGVRYAISPELARSALGWEV